MCPEIPNPEHQLETSIESHFPRDSTSCFQTTPSQQTQCPSVVQTSRGFWCREPLASITSHSRGFSCREPSASVTSFCVTSSSTWEACSDANVKKYDGPLKRPSSRRNHEVSFCARPWQSPHRKCLTHHLRRQNKRSSCLRWDEPWNSQDESGNSGIIGCPARLSRNKLPSKSPAPRKMLMLLLKPNRASNTLKVSLPISSINFPGNTETRMTAQAPCITSSILEAFLAKQRPVLKFQLFV